MIVSRIADHGVSIDDLEVVLEADFLFGSRRQQIQRTGRLFWSELGIT
jgi:superfamily II DNA or RNA helicase